MSGQLQPPPPNTTMRIDVDADLLARFQRRCRRMASSTEHVLDRLINAYLDTKLKR